MKKLTILFAALTLSAGLWAETVEYRYPVYNITNDPTSGIKEWKTTTADATEITNASSTLAAGWYVVKGTDVQTGTLTCQGAVHIILANGAKLTATGDDSNYTPGIQVSGDGNSLTIYGQSTGDQMGQLFATGGRGGAGIGGGLQGSGSNITINGGRVTATGEERAAGIGGGEGDMTTGYAGSNITINGGTVTAKGGNDGAGIGGGIAGDGFDIIINGGTVTATGGIYAAGIGGGLEGSGSNITISGGTVTATGGDRAAGIGGGWQGNGTDITINGGVIKSTGGEGAAGIGGGQSASGSNITITGGDVTANGGEDAAGIGGGNSGSGSNIKVAAPLIIKAVDNGKIIDIATNRTDDKDISKDLAGKQCVTITLDPIVAYAEGYAAGKAEAAAALPTDPEGTAGHTVTITKGEKTLILVNPDKVTYGKQEQTQ